MATFDGQVRLAKLMQGAPCLPARTIDSDLCACQIVTHPFQPVYSPVQRRLNTFKVHEAVNLAPKCEGPHIGGWGFDLGLSPALAAPHIALREP